MLSVECRVLQLAARAKFGGTKEPRSRTRKRLENDVGVKLRGPPHLLPDKAAFKLNPNPDLSSKRWRPGRTTQKDQENLDLAGWHAYQRDVVSLF